MKRTDVWLSRVIIGIDTHTIDALDDNLDMFLEALLKFPDAAEVDGPLANGEVVVTFKATRTPIGTLCRRVYNVAHLYERKAIDAAPRNTP